MKGSRIIDRRRRRPDDGRLAGENAALRAAVDALRARVTELERLADSDTLTPLPNRRLFERELARAIERVERYGEAAALLFVDMNGLKAINDSGGHAGGDAALLHVAALLRQGARASDIVARIGGDEFGLILDSIDQADARARAARLAGTIAASPLPGGPAITVSIGVAMLEAGETPAAALRRADTDMYRVKRVR